MGTPEVALLNEIKIRLFRTVWFVVDESADKSLPHPSIMLSGKFQCRDTVIQLSDMLFEP